MVVIAADWQMKMCGCSLRTMLQCSPCQWIWPPASKRGLWSKWPLPFTSDLPVGRHRRCLPPGRGPACVAAAAGKHPTPAWSLQRPLSVSTRQGALRFLGPSQVDQSLSARKNVYPCRELPKLPNTFLQPGCVTISVFIPNLACTTTLLSDLGKPQGKIDS